MSDINMSVNIAGVELKNPVTVASGNSDQAWSMGNMLTLTDLVR